MSGDFRLKDAAAYERFYGGAHPHPELLGTLRLWSARAEPRRDSRRAARSRRRAASRRPSSWALLPLARAGLLDGVVQVVGITGSSGSGVAPSLGDPSPDPRGEPQDLQGARPPAHAGDRRDAGARRARAASSCASCRCRRRCRAGSWRPASSRCRPARPPRRSPRSTRAPTRASRSCRFVRDRLPEVAAVVGQQLRRGRLHARRSARRLAHAGGGQRDRQSDQGRRRAGDPEHEPDAGPAGDGVAGGSGALALTADGGRGTAGEASVGGRGGVARAAGRGQAGGRGAGGAGAVRRSPPIWRARRPAPARVRVRTGRAPARGSRRRAAGDGAVAAAGHPAAHRRRPARHRRARRSR